MRRTLLAGPILAVAGLFAAEAVTSQAATQLNAGVVDGATSPTLLSFTENGSDVATLTAGTYTIVIDDLATNHNVHFSGPGIDQATSIDNAEMKTITVTFQAGTFNLHCDRHGSMVRTFTVVAAPTTTTTTAPPPAPPPPATPPPPPPTADPPLVRVRVKLGPAGLTLAPMTAVAGAATITLTDRSKLGNVHLKGPGVNVHTGVRSRVTRTVDATLRPGTYRLTDDAHPRRKARTMVVTAS